jgi:prolipoprotein diacylglyceryltransferase
MSEKTPAPTGETPQSAAARLFDIRVLIGGLFTLYGVMLIVAGLFTSDAQLKKASNININMWLGIGMLVLGLLFLLWWRLNPMKLEEPADDDDAGVRHD